MPTSKDVVRGAEGINQRLILYDEAGERYVMLRGAILYGSDEAELFTLANPGRVSLGDVLEQILSELQRINEQLALLTDNTIEAGETLGG